MAGRIARLAPADGPPRPVETGGLGSVGPLASRLLGGYYFRPCLLFFFFKSTSTWNGSLYIKVLTPLSILSVYFLPAPFPFAGGGFSHVRVKSGGQPTAPQLRAGGSPPAAVSARPGAGHSAASPQPGRRGLQPTLPLWRVWARGPGGQRWVSCTGCPAPPRAGHRDRRPNCLTWEGISQLTFPRPEFWMKCGTKIEFEDSNTL